MKILIFSLCALMCSCGPAYHLKKAKYHILKAQALGATWSADTVVITRTVTPPEFSGDTVFQVPDSGIVLRTQSADSVVSFDPSMGWSFTSDTLHLIKPGIDTKVKIGGHKVYIYTKCKPDTVRIKVPTVISNTITCPPCVQRIRWWTAAITGIFLLILGIALGRGVLR